ncbi:hypothetical protein B738_06164 [Photorhabdus temperata subsp. temperata M1021]|nr:hypothetical protein B738_06164 [Photorhabdus temperata subsp. temperata M1021]
MKAKDVQPTIIINNNVISLEDIYNIAIKQKKSRNIKGYH